MREVKRRGDMDTAARIQNGVAVAPEAISLEVATPLELHLNEILLVSMRHKQVLTLFGLLL